MRTSLHPTRVIYPSDPVFSTKGIFSVYANLTNLRIPITQTGTTSDASRLLGLLDTLLSRLPVLDTLHVLIGGNPDDKYTDFPDTWMGRMLLSGPDRPAYWSNRVRTLVLKQVEGPLVKTFSAQLLVVILARMSALRVLEIRIPAHGTIPELGMSRDVAKLCAKVIPDWPLERLATSAIPSGMLCALLSGARTRSLRSLDLDSARDHTDVITCARQLTRLQALIFRKDLQRSAMKGWLTVITMPTVERLRIRREQFNLMPFVLPGTAQLDSEPPLFIPSNIVHLELECKQILGSVDAYMYRSDIERWIVELARALEDHHGAHTRLRSVTLLVRPNHYTQRSPAEDIDFGPLMDVCAARRIRVDCVNIGTGIAMGIQRCTRTV